MEQLLILSHAGNDVRRRIERSAKVVQEGSDKLLVVEGSADALAQAAALPGVTTAERLGAAAARSLSPGERLFLAAWRRRQSPRKKRRAGQGLSWGAKGFKAP